MQEIKYDFNHTIPFPDEESNNSYQSRLRNGIVSAIERYSIVCGERVNCIYVGSWSLRQMVAEELGLNCCYAFNNAGEIILEGDKKMGLVTLSKINPHILLKKQAGTV